MAQPIRIEMFILKYFQGINSAQIASNIDNNSMNVSVVVLNYIVQIKEDSNCAIYVIILKTISTDKNC